MTNAVAVYGSTKEKREIVEKAVAWCIRELMPRMQTLEVFVHLKDLKGKAYGYCMEQDTNREFEIEVDKKLSLYDLVSTVCHEMVHVKQYARRELRQDKHGNTLWKKSGSFNTTAYEDCPWEKEAFRLEGELALRCFQEAL
jgi:hypothetical protein